MKKRILTIGTAVLVIAAILAVIIFADSKERNNSVSFTPDPVTGEVPDPIAAEPPVSPSFYKEAAEVLSENTVKESDVIVRFHTYCEKATAGMGSPYHCIDVAVPEGGRYTVTLDDGDFYKYDAVWAEENVVTFAPRQIMENAPADPLTLNVYKDGVLADTIRVKIEKVAVSSFAEGNEADDVCKMITSCENDSLKVVYYNFDQFKN
mgnify:CR=1 FL=1